MGGDGWGGSIAKSPLPPVAGGGGARIGARKSSFVGHGSALLCMFFVVCAVVLHR